MLFVFLFVAFVSAPTAAKTESVCYDFVGCFNNKPPYDNTHSLPDSPDKLHNDFLLYTPHNIDGPPNHVTYTNNQSLASSRFDARNPVKIIIHGFSSTVRENKWNIKIKTALLKKYDLNVIVVDWTKGALWPYPQAVANVRLLGEQIKLLLDQMVSLGTSLDNVHIIGHSLGAQTAGYIGYLTGGKLGRISALDAAQELYEEADLAVRLDKSDAKFVDAIHTDIGTDAILSFGFKEPVGHVDFFPNGGSDQPGCKAFVDVIVNQTKKMFQKFWNWIGKRSIVKRNKFVKKAACDHLRSHDLYRMSIEAPCHFKSFPCSSYENFEKAECLSCGTRGCSEMGFYANQHPGRGKQYLQTLAGEPYCGYEYKVQIGLSHQMVFDGNLSISLVGENGQTSEGYIDIDHSKVSGATLTGMIILPTNVNSAHKFSLLMRTKTNDHTAELPAVHFLSVTSLHSTKSIFSKPGHYQLLKNEVVDVAVRT